jgi:hypothetical protein
MRKKNPIQPLVSDKEGVLRFKENKIVRHLLKFSSEYGHDLAKLDAMNFSVSDRQQFAW